MSSCIFCEEVSLGKVSRPPPTNRSMKRSVKKSSQRPSRSSAKVTQVNFIDLLPLYLLPDVALIEEFGIYLNYVRKLGFEETPDYDFLRELFTKVMRTNGDVEDGVYDWNALNGMFFVLRLYSPMIQCI